MRKCIPLNENRISLKDIKAPKLNDGQKRIVLTVYDREGSISELLKTIQSYASRGHSFPVTVDGNDSEYKKDFYIDGDGSDRITDIVEVDNE